MGNMFYITLSKKRVEENIVINNKISKKKSTEEEKIPKLFKNVYVKGSLWVWNYR